MSKTVGVVLSGCGFMDGAEIHESVCTLLALDDAGVTIRCFAPDTDFDVIDHRTGEPTGERRNALKEAARIARGEISNLTTAKATDLDAVALPGGFGAAKVLSDFAATGERCTVDADLAKLLRDMHAAGKPIGAFCIAPVVVARVLGKQHPTLTIGTDPDTARTIEAWGGRHDPCPTPEIVVDRDNKIVSTPAYMLGPSITGVNLGIQKAIQAMLAMV